MNAARSFLNGVLLTAGLAAFRISVALAGDNPAPNIITVCNEDELRRAVAVGGTVQFGCSGIITLHETIGIVRDVTLDGGGMSVTISGGTAVRLFNLASNVTFEIRHITLADGWYQGTNALNGGSGAELVGESAFGGAVYNAGGTLRLLSCVLSNNAALGGRSGFTQFELSSMGGQASGGAIFCGAGASVHIDSSLLVSNRAEGGNNAEGETLEAGAEAFGGALACATGRVFVTNSEWRGNLAHTPAHYGFTGIGVPAHGGAIAIDAGHLVLVNSLLVGNRSMTGRPSQSVNGNGSGPSFGGAVHLNISTTSLVERSTFNFNQAEGGFGFRNALSGNGLGGAIHNLGDLRISDSTFVGNVAVGGWSRQWRGVALGGGVFNGGNLTLSAATFESNEVRGGISFDNIAFSGAPGGDAGGGGVCNAGALFGTNCTLAFNRSVSGYGWGGSASIAYGGGAFNAGPAMTWVNVTMASNVTEQGYQSPPPQGANLATTNGVVRLLNSLLAYGPGITNLFPFQPFFSGLVDNCSGAIIDLGHNFSTDFSCAFSDASSLSGIDPLLAPLTDNGGPTRTMALRPGSPAINAAASDGAPPIDQRGRPRPYGAAYDIGAFEAAPVSPQLAVGRIGGTVRLSFDGEKGFGYELQNSADWVRWSVLETIAPLPMSEAIARQFPVLDGVQLYRVQTK